MLRPIYEFPYPPQELFFANPPPKVSWEEIVKTLPQELSGEPDAVETEIIESFYESTLPLVRPSGRSLILPVTCDNGIYTFHGFISSIPSSLKKYLVGSNRAILTVISVGERLAEERQRYDEGQQTRGFSELVNVMIAWHLDFLCGDFLGQCRSSRRFHRLTSRPYELNSHNLSPHFFNLVEQGLNLRDYHFGFHEDRVIVPENCRLFLLAYKSMRKGGNVELRVVEL
jgi:hypothetical protein